MSETKKIILITIYSIAALLWITLLILVYTHKENSQLMEYDSSKMEEAFKNVQGSYSNENPSGL